MSEFNFTAAKLFGGANKIIEAYHKVLLPVCKKTSLPPMAVDILTFISNNPQNNTANSICAQRGLKSGIVSVHVDRLVNEGLLKREAVEGDRRKTKLVCTEKAQPIVAESRLLQKKFAEKLYENFSEEELKIFHKCLKTIGESIDDIRKNGI